MPVDKPYSLAGVMQAPESNKMHEIMSKLGLIEKRSPRQEPSSPEPGQYERPRGGGGRNY